MRWDEHGWDQFGPAQATDVRAGIDANANLVALDYTAYNHGWTQVIESSRRARRRAAAAGARRPGRPVASGLLLQRPRTTGSRARSSTATPASSRASGSERRGRPRPCSPSEQTIDALAHDANMDPIAFRLQNIDATQTNGVARWITVLQHGLEGGELEAAGLGEQPEEREHVVTGRGIAMGGFASSFPAVIADITVNKKTGKITVDHLYAAQDAGTTVNPASVENQMVRLPRPRHEPRAARAGRVHQDPRQRASTGSATRRSGSRTRRR